MTLRTTLRAALLPFLLAASLLAPPAQAELRAVAGSSGSNVSTATVAATGAGTIPRTLANHFSDIKNAADYGVICDGQQFNDGSITTGTSTLSSATYHFVAGDVGKTIVVSNTAGTQGLTTTIASLSGNNAVLTAGWGANATVPGTARATWYLTDNTTALQTAINSFGVQNSAGYNTLGFQLNIPNGICATGALTQPRLSILACSDNWNGCELFLKSGVNAALLTSEGFSTNTGTGKYYGHDATVPSWYGLQGMHLDCNKVGQTAGNCINYYGNMIQMLGSNYIENAHDNCIYTEANNQVYNNQDWKSETEGVFENVKTNDCGTAGQSCTGATPKGCGWLDRGPTDAFISNFIDRASISTGYRSEASGSLYNGGSHINKLHAYDEGDGTALYIGATSTIDEAYSDFSNMEIASGGNKIGSIYTTAVGWFGLDGIILDEGVLGNTIGNTNINWWSGANGVRSCNVGGAASTVTITIAAPAVVTWSADNCLVAGETVQFFTTGALPTGLTVATQYYVTKDATLTTSTFHVSTTRANAMAGTTITTTGTQSGTQSAISRVNAINVLAGADSNSIGPISTVGGLTPTQTVTNINNNAGAAFNIYHDAVIATTTSTNSTGVYLGGTFNTLTGSAFNLYNFLDLNGDGGENYIQFLEFKGAGTNYLAAGASYQYTDIVNVINDAGSGRIQAGPFSSASAVGTGLIVGPVLTIGADQASGFVSEGTTFTVTGCGGTLVGGGTAGTFVSGVTGSCTATITMNGATGLTAPHGWICQASDLTTVADTMKQTAASVTSTTTPVLTGTTVSGDVIMFSCTGY